MPLSTSTTLITNPQAVSFCNNIVRPLADQMIQLFYAAQTANQVFTAQGLASLLPNSNDLIVDGSANDGRPPITDGMVNILLSIAQTYVNTLAASSNLQYNQTAALAVNISPPPRQV